MFNTIYSFELKRWLKSWPFYILLVVFFSMMLIIVASDLGVFGKATAATTVVGHELINSTFKINSLISSMNMLVLFLLPLIAGTSISRDFSSNTYLILYAYPINKMSYILGKFFASITIITLLLMSSMLGLVAGTFLPGVVKELLGPWDILGILQVFFVVLLPRLIIFGAIVFAVVTITRKQYIGFIVILSILIINGLLGSVRNPDFENLIAIIEPFGMKSISLITKYWTPVEKNTLLLPMGKLFLINRFIWMSIAVITLAIVYKLFSFSYDTFTLFAKKKVFNKKVDSVRDEAETVDLRNREVNTDFSFSNRLKIMWHMSIFDYKYIVKSIPFIVFSLLGILFSCIMFFTMSYMGTEKYPITSEIGQNVLSSFSLSLFVLIYLYSGMLTNRTRRSNVDALVDSSPLKNSVFVFSRYISMSLMVFTLYALVLIVCISLQMSKSFYDFQIPVYLSLFFFDYINLLIVMSLALLIHTFVKNEYVGLFVLLIFGFGFNSLLKSLGVTQSIFLFNEVSSPSYSSMNGFEGIPYYALYKSYWGLLAIVFATIAILFLKRGYIEGFFKRIITVEIKNKRLTFSVMIVSLALFLGMGSWIYYETNIKEKRTSDKEREQKIVEYERKYSRYQYMVQPRIVSSKIDMDIYPETRTLDVRGTYILKNKSDEAIDSLYVGYYYKPTFTIDRENTLLLRDTVNRICIYSFEEALMPGDSITFNFAFKQSPKSIFNPASPVEKNGTFISNSIFPYFAYDSSREISHNSVREKYDLPEKDRMASPDDMIARRNTYISGSADWIDFETTVSTSADQIAVAPGYLQKEWTDNGRRYFNYKMDKKILNFYAFNSARYEVYSDSIDGINLEIYYHKKHHYNLSHMMNGVKDALSYYTKEFSPYQFRQLRIVEFPGGGFAQSFANTIPYSENIGFIANVNEESKNAVNYPYAVTAHEVAHQWWAHQVIGANVKGATVMSESLSEYSSLKVLEKRYGRTQMRRFLKEALDKYLIGRTSGYKGENPLMYNENQQYIHYQKGSLVLYAISDYMGEDKFNGILREYIAEVAFQEPPYTTSIEFVDCIRKDMPDSLMYLIKDMFETITLYDNRAIKYEVHNTDDGKYKVDFEFVVSKYRADKHGELLYSDNGIDSLTYKLDENNILKSIPLADYIDVGIFVDDEEVYLQKHKIEDIHNKISIIVDKKPTSLGIDPYNKLIDRISNDNRITVK